MRSLFLLFLVIFVACQQYSQTTSEVVRAEGFSNIILDFYKGDSVHLHDVSFIIGSKAKQRSHAVELEKYKLRALFFDQKRVVDSVDFQNPIWYRYEVYEDDHFISGETELDSASILLRVLTPHIDSMIIVQADIKSPIYQTKLK